MTLVFFVVGGFAILTLATIGKLVTQSAADSATDSQDTGDVPSVEPTNVPPPAVPIKTPSAISYRRDSWPTGDLVWNVCQAIAHAEGADVQGSNPDKLNNPGDLSDGAKTYGSEQHSGSNVTHFPDKATGWQWLYNKIANIRDGKSSSYSVDMTWTQLAQKYAGDWKNWSRNVCDDLGVNPGDRFGDYFGV